MTPYIKRYTLRRLAVLPLILLLTLAAAAACHTDNDDYYTTAAVTITAPEGVTIERLQGTVRLTNLNSQQTYSSATFDGTTATLDVMRGAYAVLVEGSVRYVDAEGRRRTGNFRAATSYCDLTGRPAAVSLTLILL